MITYPVLLLTSCCEEAFREQRRCPLLMMVAMFILKMKNNFWFKQP